VYEYRCDESSKAKDEESTRLVYTGCVGDLDLCVFIITDKAKVSSLGKR
jgi:hypothetical protein